MGSCTTSQIMRSVVRTGPLWHMQITASHGEYTLKESANWTLF